ncbi:MAG: chemotaxis protein CheD [Acidobacteriota bacterium]
MNERVVTVGIGEYAEAVSPDILAVYGLGSCVALVLNEPVLGWAGLAHILLPGPRASSDRDFKLPAKYADGALEVLLLSLEQKGGNASRLEAGIVGGARLFHSDTPLDNSIGERNVSGVVKCLRAKGVPVVWMDIGGTIGRSLRYHPGEGILLVRTLREEGWQEVARLDAPSNPAEAGPEPGQNS